jgi:uncharacterized protein YggE
MVSAQQKVGVLHGMGEATVLVMPDTASLSFSVGVTDKTLSVARDKAAASMDKALAVVRKLNVEGLTMNTEGFSVSPLYVESKEGAPTYYNDTGERVGDQAVGYHVTNSVSVTITGDADRLKRDTSRVIDAVLMSGATKLDGPEFSKADTVAARQDAIAQATKVAVGNVQAMARGMGVTVLRVTSASLYGPSGGRYGEPDWEPPGPPGAAAAPMPPGAAPSPVEVQAIPIDVTVWVDAEYALTGG